VEDVLPVEEGEVLGALPVEPEHPAAVTAPAPLPLPAAQTRPLPAPRPPRRPLTSVLAAFMEERNILWGELAGGLLIVGCSIALVITLWRRLEDLPYFPFLIFAGISLALFGAGQYTLHHWKLQATSHGLLVIALLLVPLNLLVLADPARAGGAGPAQPGGWPDWGVKAVALLLFAGVIRVAGRDLIGAGLLPGPVDRRWLLTLAVLGATGSPLLLPGGLLDRLPPSLLGCVPVACHVLAGGAVLAGLARGAAGEGCRLEERQANALLVFLGVATFAVLAALGFLLARCQESVAATLHGLAAPLAAAGVPVLVGGLLVNRWLAGEGLDGLRTAGTGVALAGIGVMLASAALAWPDPLPLVLACALDGAVLTAVAFRCRLPWAHAAALPCLALAYLTVFHRLAVADSERGLVQQTLSPGGAAALTALAGLLAGLAEGLARAGRRGHAIAYALGAGAAAVLALQAATVPGLDRPFAAAIVYGLCALGAVLVNFRWQRRALPYAGTGLLLAASLWTLWGGWPGDFPLWGLVLALEALGLALIAASLGAGAGPPALRQLRAACADLAAAGGLLALGLALLGRGFPAAPPHTGTAAALALAGFLLALVHGWRAWAWAGSACALAALVHLLHWNIPDGVVPRPLLAALLAHATFALLAGWAARETLPSGSPRMDRLIAAPLLRSAQITSLLAVPLLFVPPEGTTLARSGYTLWVGFLWLAVAWARRAPAWFTAFQAALSGAALFGVTAWLDGQDWLRTAPLGLVDPRGLQAYGVGLGVLGLGWVAARAALGANARIHELWQAARPPLDRIVLGILVVGQLALALAGVCPDVVAELLPAGPPALAWPAEHAHAYGAGAWVLLGVLAGVLLAALRWGEGDRAGPVLGLVLVAVTVPVLAAGQHGADLAAASALRWGLALCFLACSALVWLRGPLARLAPALGVPPAPASPAAWVRGLLVGVAGFVLLLTAQVAVLGFGGQQPAGPLAGSFFARLGWVVSNVMPLVLLSVGLAGNAVRERSPGYAFAAGLVVNGSLVGGYALAVVTGGGALDAGTVVRLLQLGSVVAALWGLGWLLTRRWVLAWRELPSADFIPRATAAPLMRTQIILGLAGNLILLCRAVLLDFSFLVHREDWIVEAGSPLGWLALVAALAALAVWQRQRRAPLLWEVPFVAGVALPVLLACSVEGGLPGWGYRALLLGLAGYGLLWSLAPWAARRQPWLFGISPSFRELPGAVGVVNLLAFFVGAEALRVFSDYAWVAAALGVMSVAWGLMAVQRRSEVLAFGAGIGVNLAVSLVVWHVYRDLVLGAWWVPLVLANVTASAGVALVWLGLRRRLPDWPAPGPLLALQAVLGLAGNTMLLLLPAGLLLLDPDTPLPPAFDAAGFGGGWLALLLAAAAALWHFGDVAPRRRLHVLALTGLSAGVLIACLARRWDGPGLWRSFHVLTAAWGLLGLAGAAAGSVAHALRVSGLTSAGDLGEPQAERFAALIPARLLGRWLEAVGLLVVLLALRGGWDDPLGPYPSAAATLAVSVMAGALAIWFCRGAHVYASGLLLNVMGVLLWSAWGPATGASFLLTNVLCLAAGAAFWSAVGTALRARTDLEDGIQRRLAPRWRFLPFPTFAAGVGLGLLTLVVTLALASDLAGGGMRAEQALAWAALAALGLALVVALWDRHARFALGGLYLLGLAVLGLTLHDVGLPAARLGWGGALALAGYAALTSLLRWVGGRWADLGRLLRLPLSAAEGVDGWLLPAQTAVACAVLALSLWVCVDFAARADRLAGPLAVLLLVSAGVLLTATAPASWAERLRPATLVLGVVAVAEAGWAGPDPAGVAPWLDRNVLLMVALAAMTAAYGAGLGRLPSRYAPWAEWGRRLGPVLGGLASLTFLVLLVQEFRLYDPTTRRTPMGGPAILTVLVALVVLMAAGIRFAVTPGRDPLGLSEKGRTLYVYAVEVLLVLSFVHVRLNVPALFTGWAAQYWTLIVMLIAFVGVGVGEFFERRGLRVLAEPLQRTGLFLPLLPLLAIWLRPPAALLLGFADQSAPGLRPMLGHLAKLPFELDRYALLWLLAGLLYALTAASRRSFRLALLAALAVNCALWSLLAHHGVGFLLHPQAWLIPLALIVLAAEHLNRDRLPPELAAALRYLAISMVYVASTADLFLAGIGDWPMALVLAVLSVAGMLAGILWRVRAFLFFGIGFLALDVFTMIWHAAVDRYQTWVWWASGIVLGVAILTLFAVFEKRRNDVLRLIEEIKRWD
jgi:hypothetical protein